MLKAAYTPYSLIFKEPAITSRETMTRKDTYFVKIWDDSSPDLFGIGECALFKGLGADDKPDYEARLSEACRTVDSLSLSDLNDYSSIRFGFETALNDLKNGGQRSPFPGAWSRGKKSFVINGLVWMGDRRTMVRRVRQKLGAGFTCIKFKIGGIDFDEEVSMISEIRKEFSIGDLEIRLDANGSFSPDNAIKKLNVLAEFGIHSIEQPIRSGQWQDMRRICASSPIDIALDEELIGVNTTALKRELISQIKPSYIILKPSLCGGFAGADEWISIAENASVGWWATSALESNIGLNAIAQWVDNHNPVMPQGLGTGQLYVNNIPSPIMQNGERLYYDSDQKWEIPDLNWRS